MIQKKVEKERDFKTIRRRKQIIFGCHIAYQPSTSKQSRLRVIDHAIPGSVCQIMT